MVAWILTSPCPRGGRRKAAQRCRRERCGVRQRTCTTSFNCDLWNPQPPPLDLVAKRRASIGSPAGTVPLPSPPSVGADLSSDKERLFGAGSADSSVARQRAISYRLRLLDVSNQYPSPVKARSSVGERFLDTEEVGGSIPPVPTRSVPSASGPPFPAMIRIFA